MKVGYAYVSTKPRKNRWHPARGRHPDSDSHRPSRPVDALKTLMDLDGRVIRLQARDGNGEICGKCESCIDPNGAGTDDRTPARASPVPASTGECRGLKPQLAGRRKATVIATVNSGRPMKCKELTNRLREAGFTATEGKGDHEIWRYSCIDKPLVITQTREVSTAVTRNSLKAIRNKRKKNG